MKKWILIGGGVVIVIIIVIFVIGISNIGPLIKTAVNTYGPGITQTTLRLEDVSVSIFSGEAKLNGFNLGNPQGFKSSEAMRVKSIFVNVNEKSLMGDPMIIDRIEMTRPEITYEMAKGTDNFRAIIDNVQKTVMGESPKEKSKEGGKGKKLLIRDFVVKDGKVTLTTAFLGSKSVSVALPDIQLKNIGGQKEGTSPAKASKEILAALYGKITSPAVTDALNKELKAMGMSLEEAIEGAKKQVGTIVKEGTKGEGGKVLDKAKGLFGK